MEKTAASTSQRLGLLRAPVALVALLLAVSALAAGYRMTLTPVTLMVDGQVRHLRTHQDTIGALLMDAKIILDPDDIVTPALDTHLEPELRVQVQRVRDVRISADGHDVTVRTHATSIGAVLEDARLSLGPHDVIETEGELRPPSPAVAVLQPAHIIVHRAIPFTLHEEDRSVVLYTTASSVGEALRQAGLTLYLADGVQPGLGGWMSPGLDVYIDRSVPTKILVDGRTLRTRTHRERVGEVLADLNVVLAGQDYATPTLDSPLGEEATIRVVRVSEGFLVEQEPIPFETTVQPDPEHEIDYQRVMVEGARGILERRIRARYEDGHEVARVLEDEYVAIPPTTKTNGYGTKIIVRTLDTPSGPVEYWRVLRMLATSYSASTAGTPRTSPWYGRTRIGLTMGHGIVAVDPRVINLRSQVYVPGYGIGIAGDTGGAIKGARIDVGYDDDNLVSWYRWVDVYLLTPVPPRESIDYTLDYH